MLIVFKIKKRQFKTLSGRVKDEKKQQCNTLMGRVKLIFPLTDQWLSG